MVLYGLSGIHVVRPFKRIPQPSCRRLVRDRAHTRDRGLTSKSNGCRHAYRLPQGTADPPQAPDSAPDEQRPLGSKRISYLVGGPRGMWTESAWARGAAIRLRSDGNLQLAARNGPHRGSVIEP